MSRATKADLDFGKAYERRGAELLAEKLWPGATVIEAAQYSDIDWMVALNGKLVGAIEVKARRVESTRYEDTLVAWRKYDAAKALKTFFKVRTACLIIFTDRAGYFWLDEMPNGRRQIVRKDRPSEPPVEHGLYLHDRLTWEDGLGALLDASVGPTAGSV
jgi:hypothetical protein